jgi:hypothetical protein
MSTNGLTTKTTTDSPDMTGMCASTHRRSVANAIRNDAIAAARAHLRKGGPHAAGKALAELIKADRRLARLGEAS